MANEMRDRLYGLLGECEKKYSAYYGEFIKQLDKAETQADFEKIYDGVIKKHDFFADCLIENGVRILPCDVGDTVYYLDGSIIVKSKVHCISFGGRYGDYKGGQIHIYDSDKDNITVKLDNFGKTVFLTKEAAEQKLKEMRGENADTT